MQKDNRLVFRYLTNRREHTSVTILHHMKYFAFILMMVSAYTGHGQIELLTDEFDNSNTLPANWLNIDTVEGWNADHLELHDINTTTPGALHMMPYSSSWYQNWRGTLIHKRVSGDFVLTTEVTALNRTSTGIPTSSYSLAGLMIRTPRDFNNGAGGWTTGGENYIFMACGRASSNTSQFEVKNTTNSNSQLIINSIPTTSDVQIRLARIDAAIIVLYRLPGESWVVHQRYPRTDFPAELQVGFVTYTDWSKVEDFDPIVHNSNILIPGFAPDPTPGESYNPDLIGRFDFARFDSVSVPPILAGVNLVTEASSSDLLSFLGYDSAPHCPDDEYVFDTIAPGQIIAVDAALNVTAVNIVATNAQAEYQALNSVTLSPNFEVQLGAEFTIPIYTGCGVP